MFVFSYLCSSSLLFVHFPDTLLLVQRHPLSTDLCKHYMCLMLTIIYNFAVLGEELPPPAAKQTSQCCHRFGLPWQQLISEKPGSEISRNRNHVMELICDLLPPHSQIKMFSVVVSDDLSSAFRCLIYKKQAFIHHAPNTQWPSISTTVASVLEHFHRDAAHHKGQACLNCSSTLWEVPPQLNIKAMSHSLQWGAAQERVRKSG